MARLSRAPLNILKNFFFWVDWNWRWNPDVFNCMRQVHYVDAFHSDGKYCERERPTFLLLIHFLHDFNLCVCTHCTWVFTFFILFFYFSAFVEIFAFFLVACTSVSCDCEFFFHRFICYYFIHTLPPFIIFMRIAIQTASVTNILMFVEFNWKQNNFFPFASIQLVGKQKKKQKQNWNKAESINSMLYIGIGRIL